MKIVTSIADLSPSKFGTVGFVPTMGAFHEGHLHLMRTAKSENDCVVVSLFVNPTQFGKNEDFDKYPRDLNRDADLAEKAGADILFAPTIAEVYPRPGSIIHVPVVTQLWEGTIRPDHFDGVSTVVGKLFNIVQPRVAYFGLKDLQQCMVIRRMVDDLNMPLELSFVETIREPDGLAMSSRNAYLTKVQRAIAPIIRQQLLAAKAEIKANTPVKDCLNKAKESLSNQGFLVDYFELVQLPDMSRTEVFQGQLALIAAAKLGNTRLIDNVVF